ncbi:VCBS repeat-containing protein [Zobellia galactanivorans]|uniref:VCBS repeat-containing protein n=1 Tax=Zobellia galactanivorans (strain DSM 12802 / CCUG 47099 / CIP 106680 / NCIMB 13871 / Dsij) TaxID=63186 RepID=UPI0026E34503|nr:VCBS repeat-containing protein [Zobellia galactanivorans]MDO6808131.1 VCBS repeat-containing protein [Zobellia galactanivorans]
MRCYPKMWGLVVVVLLCSCKQTEKKPTANQETIEKSSRLFREVPAELSGIEFVNRLEETLESNYYQYMYTYIGGGVAVGDVNNDGYDDIYFTSNSSDDKLYLNKGNLQFEDVTKAAGIEQRPGFNTGVTMVDINGDGLLDIYVSRGGWKDEDGKFKNLLYINNGPSEGGVVTFTEKAEELGLADPNRTIQATFFDFDKDNDLDVYISNTPDITSRSEILDLNKVQNDPKSLELKGSDRLYENDGTGHFSDISKKAGLLYDIGFGLNPQVGDLNNDGWDDIYICNDFNVPDLVYVNNGDGTFTESRDKLFKHMSFNSMGSDMADMNNDGLLDVMTLDMNPQDYVRSKTTMAMTSISDFEGMVENGYHYQYMHNMLQTNNGNGTFSEIGNMAGIANTDWSWALLSADFDLDGFNDIFVTNGVYRDVIDRDKNNEILEILRRNKRKPTDEDFLKFAKMLPQQKLKNFFFRNKGDLTFEDTSETWVDSEASFSNGAAYADFDNDGDLDVVVNNINDTATLLENRAVDNSQKYYLELNLEAAGKNTFGIGAVVHLYFEDGTKQMRQVIPTRGFLSSVPNSLYFGLGNHQSVQRVKIIWPDRKVQELEDVQANQSLRVDYGMAQARSEEQDEAETLFSELAFGVRHTDPYYNDYKLQILLPHKLSQLGPALAKGDFNGDGQDDVFIGGGKGQPGQLLLGRSTSFKKISIPVLEEDKGYEDIGAAFFDADGDGDKDLYVVSGSYEFNENPRMLIDRLYLNDGSGNLTKALDAIPEVGISGSIVLPSDYDGDGDIDLFIGGRLITGKYPYPASSLLLVNEAGKFSIQNDDLAPEFRGLGLVTDAKWIDIDNDNDTDLVLTGEWMGIQVFLNTNNKLERSDAYPQLADAVGWWNEILIEDIDGDGDKDIVAGNLGLNSKFHASYEKPFEIYTSDFDMNGSEDVILAKEYQGKQVPVRGKSCMTQQLPHLAQKIPTYTDFASKDLKGIVGEGLQTALHYKATEFRSGIFLNNRGVFSFQPFVNQVQTAPINSILFEDFDGDGIGDLVLAGNNYQSEVETTRSDAGIGTFLKGNGKGTFVLVPNLQSGFFADKDVRNIAALNTKGGKFILVANNDGYHNLFKLNQDIE